jgi:hypothetical protein
MKPKTIPALSGTAESKGLPLTVTGLGDTNFGTGFLNGGNALSNQWPWNATSQDTAHTHSVTTNESTTGYTGSGTAIDIRPRRLNSVVWRRTA